MQILVSPENGKLDTFSMVIRVPYLFPMCIYTCTYHWTCLSSSEFYCICFKTIQIQVNIVTFYTVAFIQKTSFNMNLRAWSDFFQFLSKSWTPCYMAEVHISGTSFKRPVSHLIFQDRDSLFKMATKL